MTDEMVYPGSDHLRYMDLFWVNLAACSTSGSFAQVLVRLIWPLKHSVRVLNLVDTQQLQARTTHDNVPHRYA